MSQISRLHNTEIANGNLIDATHLSDEFNQLVSESNSQDTRLTSAESTLTSHTSSLKSLVQGLMVTYSTSNRVIITTGLCRDSSNTELMEVTSNITVDIATSGANGLDTGAEAASTWYYLWLIKNTSTGTVAGLFSTSSSNPTLPSGYSKKRLLPIAFRNDASSNFIPFIVGSGWPHNPVILFRDYEATSTYQALNAGTATTAFTNPGGGTNINLASWAPPIAKMAVFQATVSFGSGGSTNAYLKSPESAGTTGALIGFGSSAQGLYVGALFAFCIDASQQVAYRMSASTTSLSLYVQGFVVTEVY